MKISILENREDFPSVFCDSVSKVIASEPFKKFEKIRVKFLFNSKLNFVVVRGVESGFIKPLVSDYKYNPNLARKILQLIYVLFATSRLFRRPFGSLLPTDLMVPTIFKDCVFLPGNHSIRVIDQRRNTSFLYEKPGAHKNFFLAELRGRNMCSVAPGILASSEKERWIQEKILIGRSVDRLGDAKKEASYINYVKKSLASMYSSERITVSLQVYLRELRDEFTELLNSFARDDRLISRNRVQIQSVWVSLEELIVIDHISTLELTFTHGDFQAGNIHVSDCGVYLIDWEYCDTRSFFFDAFTEYCRSRSQRGLTDRLLKTEYQLQNGSVSLAWTSRSLDSDCLNYFYVFCLEELMLLLKEYSDAYIVVNEPMIDRISEYARFADKR